MREANKNFFQSRFEAEENEWKTALPPRKVAHDVRAGVMKLCVTIWRAINRRARQRYLRLPSSLKTPHSRR